LTKRVLVLASMLLALCLFVAACGDDEETSTTANEPAGTATATADAGDGALEGKNVTFLPKAINNPYFDSAAKGAETAAGELSGEFKQVGPSEASAPAQVPFINNAASQKADALVVSANDPNALVPALKRAAQAGVKIVTYDSDVDPSARAIFVNQVESDEVGKVQIKLINDQVGAEGGEIAILSAASTATNQNAWIDVMKEELKKPEYSKLKLVKVAYGNDDDQKSFQETNGLLQAYPNLKGIISPTTVGIAAAARALDAKKLGGKVFLTGLGTPNQLRKFVKNGVVPSFALWDPGQLGYLAYYAATALANGTITGKEGDKFTAGELGDYTVGADGVVILGPPTEFTKDNIDDFDF
jgi:rhamnose transport system substrate-binding protein